MNTKRLLNRVSALLLSLLLFSGLLTGCRNTEAPEKDGLSVVTTIFPEYDWAMNILGSRAGESDVTMLLDNGVDLHSYQPTADDIIRISTCDVFVYVGGESDAWVRDALKEVKNEDMIVVDLLDGLGSRAKEEVLLEGMQSGEEHEHEHEKHEHEDEPEYDEHIWLSLKNAAASVQMIADAVKKADPAHAADYETNAAAYIEKLNALDTEYQNTVDGASCRTLLFGDRFPFLYMADDYALTCYAAFSGCSAESEAAFETVTFLAGKLDELKLKTVLTLKGSDNRIAETVIAASSQKDAQILSLDSMQSTTSADIRNGLTYLSAMEKNLQTLKEALN